MVNKSSKTAKTTSKTKTKSRANASTPIQPQTSATKVLKNICLILLPLIVGMISVLFTGNQMSSFANFNKPPLAPPAWLFPIAWTILYILMGVASVFYFKQPKKGITRAKINALRALYIGQLAFNFLWTIFFFGLGAYAFSFVWLMLLWAMVLALLILSFRDFKVSFWCLLPYIVWLTFAGYLNISIALLN